MQTLLLVAELIIAVALICFVLLQRSEGGALGMGGGSSMGGLFTPRGAADTLTRTTAILGFLFFATCIGLNLLALHHDWRHGGRPIGSARPPWVCFPLLEVRMAGIGDGAAASCSCESRRSQA